MYKKLFVALSLIAGQAMAMEPMELIIEDERATPTDITEKKIVLLIQDQVREIPVRFIHFIGALADLYKEDSLLHLSPITLINLDTWQLIEEQLERVYAMTQGDHQLRIEIIADYTKLDNDRLIDLLKVVDFLTIPLLKEITLEIAQNKLTFDEVLKLPEYVRNEIIKGKALTLAGPMPVKEEVVCKGHEGAVRPVCVTPDGKIVSGSMDNTVRIWSMDGQELAVCRGHEGAVRSVCVTHDDKIVSGSLDKTVRIWDMKGQELAVCKCHEGWVTSVCVTPDGKIVSGSVDHTVRVNNMNGRELAVCRGHEQSIIAVYTTPDDKIVSGSLDTTVRVWDMNGQELAVCKGHENWVSSVCITPDGKIISGSHDNPVQVWDMKGQELAVCRGHEGKVWSICVTQDGRIVFCSADHTVRVWSVKGKQLAVCRGHEDEVWSVCLTRDGKIFSGSKDGTVRIWDMNGQELAVCRGHENAVRSVSAMPNGKIVSGSRDKTLRIWDLSLLDRLSAMNTDQEQAICKLLKSASCENQEQKEHCWKEIANILKKEELDGETKKRKELENSENNASKKLRFLEEEELVIESKQERNHE